MQAFNNSIKNPNSQNYLKLFRPNNYLQILNLMYLLYDHWKQERKCY